MHLFLFSGGIRVTVVGENLDSVATPLFYIYEERRNISTNTGGDNAAVFIRRYTTVSRHYAIEYTT